MGDHDMTTSVGWIGAGRMGYALIERLLDAGYEMSVYNRTGAKAEPLVEQGAKLVDTAAQFADRDVVFIMVAASNDLEDVTTGEDGLRRDRAQRRQRVDGSRAGLRAALRCHRAGPVHRHRRRPGASRIRRGRRRSPGRGVA